jgi:hypothetical protein
MHKRRNRLLVLLAAVIVFSVIAARAIERRYRDNTTLPDFQRPGIPVMAHAYLVELEEQYGKKRYSYFDEETLIRDVFQDERNGYFVDIGASHYASLSNTYYLEKNLGWKGIGVDAQDRYAADYARYRPNTKYLVFFVSDPASSGKQVEFLVDLQNEYLSSGVDGAVLHASRKIVVTAITMDELLDREGVTKVDFISMDIEDGEPAALAGFSIQRWKPRLLCVEMHAVGASRIAEYFSRNGYVRLDSYSYIDYLNGYFVPAGSPAARRDDERLRSWTQALGDAATGGGPTHEQ